LTNNIYFKHLTMETVDPLSLNEGHWIYVKEMKDGFQLANSDIAMCAL
jgi:hypothetical protein